MRLLSVILWLDLLNSNIIIVYFYLDNVMKENYECNVHLKANGEPDVEYYVLEANRMSSEIISGLLRNTASWLKKQLKIER